MKNKTLLKVLSASAIFTAIAAIESYDHNAFATEVSATATDNQSDVETKTVPQDVKNLPDGIYDIKSVGEKKNVEALNFSEEDKKSISYKVEYRTNDKTLKEEDIKDIEEKIINDLNDANIVLRS